MPTTLVNRATGVCALFLIGGCADVPKTRADGAQSVAPATVAPRSAPAPLAAIDARVDSIEKYLAAHPEALALYAQMTDTSRQLVSVKDSSAWPDEIAASFNILRDTAGRMLLHREMPTSESGDWFEVRTHYFAPDGRTVLFDYRINGFSGGCGILRERRKFYYDSAFALLRQDSSYTDDKDNPIDASECHRRGDHPEPARRRSADLLGGP
jgi:hypothetical protein